MILDATCGARLIYGGLDKEFNAQPHILIDNRIGIQTPPPLKDGTRPQSRQRSRTIEPTICASLAQLPFRDNTFNLIIFDPPWIKPSDILFWTYGGWTHHDATINHYRANKEFHRVLQHSGVLLVKYQELAPANKSLQNFIRTYNNFQLLLRTQNPSRRSAKTPPTLWLLFARRDA
jgi:hypothetical protein